MSTGAEEIQRIVSASVRDMLDAYRIQAQAGTVTDKALEEIIFRASHGVLQSLAPRAQRVALLRAWCPCCSRPSLRPWWARTVQRAGGKRDDGFP